MLGGFGGRLRHRIQLSLDAWRTASNPRLQGAALGLNIPSCAAPILFALIGVATTAGSALTGFALMAAFALTLSLPLLPLSAWLDRDAGGTGEHHRRARRGLADHGPMQRSPRRRRWDRRA